MFGEVASDQVTLHSEHFQQSMDQSGIVINPARGHLNMENVFFPVPVRA